jgi:hypothetical protein
MIELILEQDIQVAILQLPAQSRIQDIPEVSQVTSVSE